MWRLWYAVLCMVDFVRRVFWGFVIACFSLGGNEEKEKELLFGSWKYRQALQQKKTTPGVRNSSCDW